MRKKLIKVGNSEALIMSKDMKEHLGVRETIEVTYDSGRIILSRPTMILEDAEAYTDAKFHDTYRELAK